jgi:hypothetical protein
MKHLRRVVVTGILLLAVLLPPVALAEDFHGCPSEGEGGDPALNLLKNREEVPATFEPMHFQELHDLDVPEGIGKRHRDKWPTDIRESVGQQEKRAVQVVGYLLKVKLEGQESPNCHSDDPALRDFHIWLANSPEDDRWEAVVVEITPRIRARHASWSRTNLNRLVNQQSRVRISGWLMLDPEHPDQLGKTRVTLWEIHPILKIEVWSGGRWREF